MLGTIDSAEVSGLLTDALISMVMLKAYSSVWITMAEHTPDYDAILVWNYCLILQSIAVGSGAT